MTNALRTRRDIQQLFPAACICGAEYRDHQPIARHSNADSASWLGRACPTQPRADYRPTGVCFRKP